jgi:hypothetical protein
MIDISTTWRVRSVLFYRIVPGWKIFIANVEIRCDVVPIELGVFSIYADVSKVVGFSR